MAEGDTILRLARRLEAELGGETLSAAAPNPRDRAAGVERLDGMRQPHYLLVPGLPALRRRRPSGPRATLIAPMTRFRRQKKASRSAEPVPRRPAYYLVAGVQLDREMARLRTLPVFAGGPLAAREPQLKVRRARRRPNRLGFAVPSEFRLSVTAYPGIRPGDVLETLLHELVHLHVGRAAEAHAWHGRTFKETLSRAMREAYGIACRPSSTLHGSYAEELQRTLVALAA